MTCTLAATFTVAVCAYYSTAASNVQLRVLVGCSAVQLALVAWVAFSKKFDAITLRQVIATALLISIVGLFCTPMLEDDQFRYLWDGYITASSGRPYLHAPSFYFSDTNIPENLQSVLSGINNPEVSTIYGPLLQLIFAASYLIAPAQVWPLKVFLLLALIASVMLLHKKGIHTRWLLILCIHPLVIKESVISAHPDLLIGAMILFAVILWRTEFYRQAVVVVCAAAAIKITTAALLLFFCFDKHGRFRWPVLLTSTLALLAFHIPVLLEFGAGSFSGAAAFAQQWVFNPLLYRLIAFITDTQTARIFVGILVVPLAFVALLRQRNRPHIHHSILVFLTGALLLAPVINPWYWLWLLPLATLSHAVPLWVAASVSMLAYFHVLQPNSFVVPQWATIVQAAGIFSAFLWSWFSKLNHDV